MKQIKIALVICTAFYIVVALTILMLDVRNGDRKGGVVIHTIRGSVVHIEASESAVITTQFPITFAPEPMARTVRNANVYAGPATTYAVIGSLQRGEERRIVQKSQDQVWLQICCAGGQVGWISAVDLEALGDISGLPTYIDLRATEQVTK